MIVVSNTSPIINLAAIRHLNILHKLYTNIVIPTAVYNEIVIMGEGQPGSIEVQEYEWITTENVTNNTFVKALKIELDAGEAETIALALQIKSDFVIIDERLGRNVASRFNLKCTGMLGVIVEAKIKGLIPRIKPLLDDLKNIAGFWIDNKLYAKILLLTNEQ